jgi:hypothetical protein
VASDVADTVKEGVGGATEWVEEHLPGGGESGGGGTPGGGTTGAGGGGVAEGLEGMVADVEGTIDGLVGDVRERYGEAIDKLREVAHDLAQPVVEAWDELEKKLDEVLAGLDPTAAKDDVKPGTETCDPGQVTLNVTDGPARQFHGRDLRAVAGAMGQDKPGAEAATCTLTASARYDDANKERIVNKVDITLNEVIRMPRWVELAQTPDKFSDPVKEEWDRAWGGLKVHEDGHVETDKAVFDCDLISKMTGKKRAEADVLWNAANAFNDAENKKYDTRTGKGQSQGSYITKSIT